MSDQSKRDDSTPGLNNLKRDAIGTAMRVLTRFTGWTWLKSTAWAKG